VLLTNVVVSAEVPAIATEEGLKFVPVKVKVVSLEPAKSEVGLAAVSVGAGLVMETCVGGAPAVEAWPSGLTAVMLARTPVAARLAGTAALSEVALL
jgi:hypothetical protein